MHQYRHVSPARTNVTFWWRVPLLVCFGSSLASRKTSSELLSLCSRSRCSNLSTLWITHSRLLSAFSQIFSCSQAHVSVKTPGTREACGLCPSPSPPRGNPPARRRACFYSFRRLLEELHGGKESWQHEMVKGDGGRGSGMESGKRVRERRRTGKGCRAERSLGGRPPERGWLRTVAWSRTPSLTVGPVGGDTGE